MLKQRFLRVIMIWLECIMLRPGGTKRYEPLRQAAACFWLGLSWSRRCVTVGLVYNGLGWDIRRRVLAAGFVLGCGRRSRVRPQGCFGARVRSLRIAWREGRQTVWDKRLLDHPYIPLSRYSSIVIPFLGKNICSSLREDAPFWK